MEKIFCNTCHNSLDCLKVRASFNSLSKDEFREMTNNFNKYNDCSVWIKRKPTFLEKCLIIIKKIFSKIEFTYEIFGYWIPLQDRNIQSEDFKEKEGKEEIIIKENLIIKGDQCENNIVENIQYEKIEEEKGEKNMSFESDVLQELRQISVRLSNLEAKNKGEGSIFSMEHIAQYVGYDSIKNELKEIKDLIRNLRSR